MFYSKTHCECDRFCVLILTLLTFLGSAQKIPEELTSHKNWKLLDRGDNCGHSIADRIVGGERATIGQYPWMVQLAYSDNPFSLVPTHYLCGGAIISDRYILTAAHCGSDVINATLLEAIVGEYDTSSDKDCLDSVCGSALQEMEVENQICHPQFNSRNFDNDICLIRLTQSIKFDDYVSPICLPAYDTMINNNFEDTIMEVAGWGYTDYDTQQSSDILLTLKVPVVPHYHCSLTYSGMIDITSTQMCAGGTVGKDSCSGDSGGPLMKPFSINGPPRYFLIGIVSNGPKSCGQSNTPGIYTIVSKYWKWILDNIE